MTATISDKMDRLRELLTNSLKESPSPAERGVLVIYPPEHELEFRQRLDDLLVTLQAQGVAHTVVDAEMLPFKCLDAEGLLEDAFRLEAEEPKELRQYLAVELPRRLQREMVEAASTVPIGSAIFLKSAPALFPWVKFADFLAGLPTGFSCRIIVPFPGHEHGAALNFLDHRDGFNYMARRIN